MKMTISLLQAYDWYLNCPKSWKDRAYESIINTLTSEFTGSAATLRGESYEEQVNRVLRSDVKFEGIQKPLEKLRGTAQQVWIKPLDVILHKSAAKNMKFTFKGKMDFYGIPSGVPMFNAWGKDDKVICDLKTTGSVIKQAKYSDSLQHVVYCLAMQCPRFMYFVARFIDDSALQPVEVQVFPIDLTDNWDELMPMLSAKISGFVTFLKDNNLWDTYFNIYNKGVA